jgi:hypothetical protein
MNDTSSPDAAYFAMIAHARKQKSKLTIDDIRAYNQQQSPISSEARIVPLYRMLASAAAVLVFVIAGLLVWNYSEKTVQPAQMAETFDDPYKAYEEIREALAYVSAKMNKPQQEAMINIKKAGEYADMFK